MPTLYFTWVKENILPFLEERVSLLPEKGHDLIVDVLNVFYLISTILAPYLTGGLRDSIQVYLGSTDGYVTSYLDYFKFVILGTDEHDIGSPVWIPQAVGWRYIGLSPAGRGKPHPGTKPNDFMADSFDEGLSEANIRMDNFMEWLRE